MYVKKHNKNNEEKKFKIIEKEKKHFRFSLLFLSIL